MPPDGAITERVHRLLLDEVDRDGDLALRAASIARAEAPLLDAPALAEVVRSVTARAHGLGPLEQLLADASITEVMVNGPGPVWIERGGRIERLALELDRATIEHIVERIVGPLGLRVDRSSPVVDARLPDGSRVNAVVPPLAVDGPYLTIRRFAVRHVDLSSVCATGVAELLAWAVRARCNILVSGGTGAGKTTLLNALAAHVPEGERVVTVEDTAELRLEREHVVRLEARTANAEGTGEVTVRDLVRNVLRMRPDRIVVGEVRGPEALDMLQAMNTGHEGSLSTCHANSPADALRRLETMVLTGSVVLPLEAVREQLSAAIDLVVQIARAVDGSRRVVAVAEVGGADRVRLLAGPAGLQSLPTRPVRERAAGCPDRAWLIQ